MKQQNKKMNNQVNEATIKNEQQNNLYKNTQKEKTLSIFYVLNMYVIIYSKDS